MPTARLVLSALCLAAGATHAAPQVDIIASGLNNPRGIAFAPNGQLFVAEAGSGGNGACITAADNRSVCYGESGALLRIDPAGVAAPVRVISGLPSLAAPGGFGGIGPHSISFHGAGNGQLALGLGAKGSQRVGLGPKAAMLGTLLQVAVDGGWKQGADLAAFEEANSPVPGGIDSNPYGAIAMAGRSAVADAGANALFGVKANGKLSVLAAFEARMVDAPPFLNLPAGSMIPMQSVPTSVVDGHDGYLYAGELTGFPFVPGAARVLRVPLAGGTPEVYAAGFTNIGGLAFDASHRLHVLQIGNGLSGQAGPPLATPGKLIRINADGSRTTLADNLFYPGGLAIANDGTIYVTNFGIVPGATPPAFPTGGQVLRIKP
ncbi:ScyD/ScyE family protein [Pseudoduganella sp. OTU4001]|uniref:ScyD/ScyE family protein n=1 Tax=Pseudoduganella sp. OTU4001 TaxID=3043854 RepID=UPI00313C41E0